MYRLDYNIISKDIEQRLASISEEKYKEYDAEMLTNHNLISFGRRTRLVPETGDVFVLSIVEGKYFYGKVLKAFKLWGTDAQVVAIFANTSETPSIENYKPDYDNLLFAPIIVYHNYWKRGLFKNITNIPLTLEEEKLDYGFFRMDALERYGYFVNAEGEELDYKPKLYDEYGMTTIYGVYSCIKLELLFRPELI